MYERLKPLKEKLLSLSIDEVPAPWKLLAVFSVGGLRSVGFDRESENLLVVSSQGRGVIDCLILWNLDRVTLQCKARSPLPHSSKLLRDFSLE